MPFVLGALLLGCQSKTTVKLETFPTETGWGYLIKTGDKVFIKQEFIPAVPGEHSFASKIDAEKIGTLILQKLKKKQHPSVTVEELDSLQIQYPSSR